MARGRPMHARRDFVRSFGRLALPGARSHLSPHLDCGAGFLEAQCLSTTRSRPFAAPTNHFREEGGDES